MRFFSKAPDGGANSGVTAYFLIEWKSVFSIALLRFDRGSREAFHEHAFSAITLWLKGQVRERVLHSIWPCETSYRYFSAGDVKHTPRDLFHRIEAVKVSWALTLRGPWRDQWCEYRDGKLVTLTHGRVVCSVS